MTASGRQTVHWQSTRSTHIDRLSACGLTSPREAWGTRTAPLMALETELVTCPGCIACLDMAQQAKRCRVIAGRAAKAIEQAIEVLTPEEKRLVLEDLRDDVGGMLAEVPE